MKETVYEIFEWRNGEKHLRGIWPEDDFSDAMAWGECHELPFHAAFPGREYAGSRELYLKKSHGVIIGSKPEEE